MIEPASTKSFISPERTTILAKHFSAWQVVKQGRSLRGFARKLELSPTHLSNLLAGRRVLTQKTAAKISARLSLSEKEEVELLSQVNRPSLRESANDESEAGNLSEEQFRFIADWHHMGLLALCKLRDFYFNEDLAAKKLGVSKSKIRSALSRLVKLDLVNLDRTGCLQRSPGRKVIANHPGSRAIRIHHQQALEKAQKALDHIEPEFRQFETSTLAISMDLLPSLKEEISRFHDRIEKLASKTDAKSEVYILSSQLHPAGDHV